MTLKRCASPWMLFFFLASNPSLSSADSPYLQRKHYAAPIRPADHVALPFDLKKVYGLHRVNLSEAEKALLARNGFVVTGPSYSDVNRLCRSGLSPIFVTIDPVIEVFLYDFAAAWRALEKKQAKDFLDAQDKLWRKLLTLSWTDMPNGQGPKVGLRLLAMTAVGCRLADAQWQLPKALPEGIDAGKLTRYWQQDLDSILNQDKSKTGYSAIWDRNLDWSKYALPITTSAVSLSGRYALLKQWWGGQGFRGGLREERLCAVLLAWAATPAMKYFEKRYDALPGLPGGLRLDFLDEPNSWPEMKAAFKEQLPKTGSDAMDRIVVQRLANAPMPSLLSEAIKECFAPDGMQEIRLFRHRLLPEDPWLSQLVSPPDGLAEKLGRDPEALPNRRHLNGLDLLALDGHERALAQLVNQADVPQKQGLKNAILRLQPLYRKAVKPTYRFRGYPYFSFYFRKLMRTLACAPKEKTPALFLQTQAYQDMRMGSALGMWVGLRYHECKTKRYRSGKTLSGFWSSGYIWDQYGLVDPNLDAWTGLMETWAAACQFFRYHGITLSSRVFDLALPLKQIAEKQLRHEYLDDGDRQFLSHYRDHLINKFSLLRWTPYQKACVALSRSWHPDTVRWAGRDFVRIYAIVERAGAFQLIEGWVYDYYEHDEPQGGAGQSQLFKPLMTSRVKPAPLPWMSTYRVP